MKSILFLAPPAAGKGTQAKLMSDKYHIPCISIGDIMRENRDENTEIGRIIINCQDNRELVPLDITISLIKERLMKEDCQNGYILDGFPRSIEQAYEYDKILVDLQKELGIVIFLDIDKEVALKRTMSRIVCSHCGRTYNLLVDSLKPKLENFCDECHAPLRIRSDDNEITFTKGFETYLKKTFDLIEFYENKGLLHRIHVDDKKTPQEIFNEIEEVLKSNEIL